MIPSNRGSRLQLEPSVPVTEECMGPTCTCMDGWDGGGGGILVVWIHVHYYKEALEMCCFHN